jgi:hypothetical protein
MKVANIIIAHKNPGQLLKLINLFDKEQFHNFVHIDKQCNANDFKEIATHPNVTLVKPSRKLVWAGYGFVAVTLDALKMISAHKEKYFYTNLISGMDLPIKSTSSFYHHLLNSYQSEKNEFFEILDLSVWPGAHRFEKYHLCDITIKGRYFTERIISNIIGKRTFYKGKLIPYGRSAWFTATDDFIKYALHYFERNPDYLSFLKTTWSPDEFIFNTLIMNSHFRPNISHYLRYIDWSEKKVSPKVLTNNDVKTLLESNCFLARKFDENIDAKAIDKIIKSISPVKASNENLDW